MTKPTLLQTILNRPSQSYTAKLSQNTSSRPDLHHIATEPGQSGGVSQPAIASTSTVYVYPSSDYDAGATVSPRSPPVNIQGSTTHVPSSHASQTFSPSTSSTTTVSASSYTSSPPILPPKDYFSSKPTPRSSRSRNNVVDLGNASQERAESTGTYLAPRGLSLKKSSSFDDGEGDGDDGSTADIFYTPNSSPRASFTSSTSIPMSYGTAAAVTHHKINPRPPLGNAGGLDRELSHRSVNSASKSDARGTKQDSPISSSKVVNPTSNSTLPTTRSPISTEPSSSRTTPATQTSLTSSTRVAVPSTRTPSRSNSLNRSRTTVEYRSVPPTSGSTKVQGQGQGQNRATAAVSMVSNTSSMSSNTLDGHSVLFSDLATETTRATTPLADGNVVKSSSKKGHPPGASDATKQWVDKAASSSALKATTTPMNQHAGSSSRFISQPQPKQRPSKSHTYDGLGITSISNSSNASAFASPTLYQQYQYQQYQRKRDNKSTSVMMSMTAVLEAAEEDELYRYGKQKGSTGSSAWRARQLLRQHQSNRKVSVVEAGPGTGSRVDTDLKGKGKESAGVNPVRGRPENGDKINGGSLYKEKENKGKGKGKERESSSASYVKHQPITSSPLAISSKPLPIPGTAPPPRNNSLLAAPGVFRQKLGHRRSRSLGSESKPMYQRSESPTSSPGSGSSVQQDIITPRITGHLRVHSLSHNHASSSSMTGTADTVDLTALPRSSGELPSKGTAGYTALVLPRAPPPLNLDGNAVSNGLANGGFLGRGGDGKVDLTKDGLAQTTMASVEVVRGLGSTAGRKGLMGMLQFPLVRRMTVPAKMGLGARTRLAETRVDEDEQVAGSIPGLTSVLGFTSHRKPPEYVPSGSVLVQVWAVGVDGVDGRLIGVRMVPGSATNSNGTVPPSPATTTSTDRDQEPEIRQEGHQMRDASGEIEDQGDRPKPKSAGLGRSLSLRERISRSVSIGRSGGKDRLHQRRQERQDHSNNNMQVQSSDNKQEKSSSLGPVSMPGIGHVPGRSFVGRVVECGWEVRDEVVRKGDWVAGLLDIKKCGALLEFVVVDRHRVHRVPQPQLSPVNDRVLSALIFSPPSPTSSTLTTVHHSLTLEELALLPLCGVPAYRAVRTFMYAFSSMRDNPSISSVGRPPEERLPPGQDPHKPIDLASYGAMISRRNLGDHEHGRRRRALVLRGHDGVGAMAVQMLVLRGWRVCVHVPFIASPPNKPTTSTVADGFMEEVENRIRKWGAEEVIFDDGEIVGTDEGRGAVVRVVNGLREDGDVFDAVLDTVGGKEVREAAERLLRSPATRANTNESINGSRDKTTTRRMGQFTTIVGDNPERPIPSARDLFLAGIRSLKFGSGGGGSSSILSSEKASSESVSTRTNDSKGGKVGYAWINISQDVDWEGKDVGETVGSLVELALEYGIKPWVGAEHTAASATSPNRRGASSTEQSSAANGTPQGLEFVHWEGSRIVPFEKAPDVFISGGPLTSGGTVVVKIAT